VRL
ncbi:bacterial regulatory helix-turn-helix s, AraC family protein, partial [Vibrio parahaemolyticus V-223/04]|jgi:hypothetical protein